jgi:hypothetical protein
MPERNEAPVARAKPDRGVDDVDLEPDEEARELAALMLDEQTEAGGGPSAGCAGANKPMFHTFGVANAAYISHEELPYIQQDNVARRGLSSGA